MCFGFFDFFGFLPFNSAGLLESNKPLKTLIVFRMSEFLLNYCTFRNGKSEALKGSAFRDKIRVITPAEKTVKFF